MNIENGKAHLAYWSNQALAPARLAYGKRIILWLLPLWLVISPLAGCKSSHSREAATIAQQGSKAAATLAMYYHQMAVTATEMPPARVVEDTLAARMILPEDTAALSQAYRVQAGHYAAREAMANTLKALYDEMNNLAENKPDDVIGAASNLQSAIVRLNGSHRFGASLSGKHIDNALIQQHFDKAIGFLFDLQKSGKTRESNADTLSILTELKGVVDEEKALYCEDATVFAAEGHSLATAMTKANFATGAGHDAFGSSSPLYELLAPYTLKATQSSPADTANVGQVLTTFGVEESYQDARLAATRTPENLQSAINAQIARQKAFAHETQ